MVLKIILKKENNLSIYAYQFIYLRLEVMRKKKAAEELAALDM